MGAARKKCRRPPKFAWTQVPETRRHVSKVVEECNWLQALEGGIDTSHAPILHRLLTDNSDARRDQAIEPVCPRQGGPTSSSTSPITAISMPASAARRFGRAHPDLSFRHAVPSDPPVALGIGAADGRRPHLGPDG